MLFNLALTLLVCYQNFAVWVFEDISAGICNIRRFPWSNLPWHDRFPYSELTFGVLHLLVILFLSPLIVKLIWNRLVCAFCPIRAITYGEAYTTFLAAIFLLRLL